jgi:hypothetical protein
VLDTKKADQRIIEYRVDDLLTKKPEKAPAKWRERPRERSRVVELFTVIKEICLPKQKKSREGADDINDSRAQHNRRKFARWKTFESLARLVAVFSVLIARRKIESEDTRSASVSGVKDELSVI